MTTRLALFACLLAVASCATPPADSDTAVFRLERADGSDFVWPNAVAQGHSVVVFGEVDDALSAWASSRPNWRVWSISPSDVRDPERRLARRLNVTPPAIVHFERGVRRGTWTTAEAFVAAHPAPGPRWKAVTDRGEELGTTYDVVVWIEDASREARARDDLAKIRARCRAWERRLSEWREDSEISRVNREAGLRWVPLSKEMHTLLTGALHVARATGGAFDPTFAAWQPMWRNAEKRGRRPTDEERAEVRPAIGFDKVDVRDTGVRFRDPGMRLGIAGFAKGWIIDDLHAELRRIGYDRVIVNIGGDLRMTDPADERGITIRDPFTKGGSRGRLAVRSAAVATSANTIRFRTIEGRRIGHILDPRTGDPSSFEGSVTVITRDAAMADALATALHVMGPEEGLAFVKRTKNVEALFVTRDAVLRSWEDGEGPATSSESTRSD